MDLLFFLANQAARLLQVLCFPELADQVVRASPPPTPANTLSHEILQQQDTTNPAALWN
jgi:hypothetical protein